MIYEYLKIITQIPTWKDAITDAHRFPNGPMTEFEYQERLFELNTFFPNEMIENIKRVENLNKIRSRTTIGHYIRNWCVFLTQPFTYTFNNYKKEIAENTCDDS